MTKATLASIYNFNSISNVKQSTDSFSNLQSLVDLTPNGSVLFLFCDYKAVEDGHVVINKDLEIDGQGHVLDCAGLCRAIYSNSGNVVLKNLKIINGYVNGNNPFDMSYYGGAILIEGSAKYALENCNFTNNWADDEGGAICNDGSNILTIRKCVFKSNKADDMNGGAISSNWDVYVYDSIFEGNFAKQCGGAIFTPSSVYVYDSIFNGNIAKEWGGAICMHYIISNVTVIGSTFRDNSAGSGGAIYSEGPIYINKLQGDHKSFFINNKAVSTGGAVNVENYLYAYNVVFNANTALIDGGAIWSNELAVENCSFDSNRAEGDKLDKSDGGAIYTKTLSGDVKNCVFYNNYAQNHGGAIYIFNENSIKFTQCVILINHAGDEGGAIYIDSIKSTINLVNNIIMGNSAKDGHVVFNKGSYASIYNNWWGDVNPSFDNHLLVEWKCFYSNENRIDLDPLRNVLALEKNLVYAGQVVKAYSYFVKSDGSRFYGDLPIHSDLNIFFPNHINVINRSHTNNMAIATFTADEAGTYSIYCNLHGQIITVHLNVFPQNKLGSNGTGLSNLEGSIKSDVHSTIAEIILSNIESMKNIIASENNGFKVTSNLLTKFGA